MAIIRSKRRDPPIAIAVNGKSESSSFTPESLATPTQNMHQSSHETQR